MAKEEKLLSYDLKQFIYKNFHHKAPPEIGDGLPPQWSNSQITQATLIHWWQNYFDFLRQKQIQLPLFLYIHVPFCRTLCRFCQFSSVLAKDPKKEISQYLHALEQEILFYNQHLGPLNFDAITIGGGTPSFLETADLDKLISQIQRNGFSLKKNGYFSAEFNPDSADYSKMEILYHAGLNRLSLGVQSLTPEVLKVINRGYQTTKMVEQSIQAARRLSDLKISLDVIAPLPLETGQSFKETLQNLYQFEPEQLVVFDYQPAKKNKSLLPAGDLPLNVIEDIASEMAAKFNYRRLEIASPAKIFIKNDLADDVVRYFQHPREPSSLLGLGPFAESYVFGQGQYFNSGNSNSNAYKGHPINLESELTRFISRSILTKNAIDNQKFREVFSIDIRQRYSVEVKKLVEATQATISGELILFNFRTRNERLTALWNFFDDQLLQDIILKAFHKKNSKTEWEKFAALIKNDYLWNKYRQLFNLAKDPGFREYFFFSEVYFSLSQNRLDFTISALDSSLFTRETELHHLKNHAIFDPYIFLLQKLRPLTAEPALCHFFQIAGDSFAEVILPLTTEVSADTLLHLLNLKNSQRNPSHLRIISRRQRVWFQTGTDIRKLGPPQILRLKQFKLPSEISALIEDYLNHHEPDSMTRIIYFSDCQYLYSSLCILHPPPNEIFTDFMQAGLLNFIKDYDSGREIRQIDFKICSDQQNPEKQIRLLFK